MATVTINAHLGNTIRRIRVVTGRMQASELGAFWDRMTDKWAESRREMFASQGFGRWPSYRTREKVWLAVKRKIEKGRDPKLLRVRSGGASSERLMKALTDRNHRDFRSRVTRDGLEIRVTVPYLENHLGGRRAPAWMGGFLVPKRDPTIPGTFRGKQRSLLARLLEAIAQFIAGRWQSLAAAIDALLRGGV